MSPFPFHLLAKTVYGVHFLREYKRSSFVERHNQVHTPGRRFLLCDDTLGCRIQRGSGKLDVHRGCSLVVLMMFDKKESFKL
ncbi:MAG: hypothetical protein CL920_36400 [Deltaproteobacteria bacterium]|nr:hypothetical protein [Deltaproteobacteria bacterium]